MNDMEKVYEQFLQIEADNDLFNTLQVNQIKIWHYVRYNIYGILTEIIGGIENPNLRKQAFEQKTGLFQWIDDNIIKNQFRVTHKDVLIMDHPRRVKQGKYYNDIYTDEWLKNLKKSYYVFEHKYGGVIHFKPVRTKNLRYIDIPLYMKVFRKKYAMNGFKGEANKVSNYIIKLFEDEYEIQFTGGQKKQIRDQVFNTLVARVVRRDYYGDLLKRVRPKVIVYVVGYSFDNMILAELGKELGIPTVEIQHGHMGNDALPYNFKVHDFLPALPDYLFVTGQFEKDHMRIPIKKDNIYVVGSTEMDQQVKYYRRIETKKKKKTIITFITSGEHELAEAALELSKKLDMNQYKIYFKLHPSEYTTWREKYPCLLDTDVCVADGSKHDVYYYLAVSDYMIGIASTVLYEATRFNCNIMILKQGRYFKSKNLIETGSAVYIDSMQDVFKHMKDNKYDNKISNYYYCENSCQLIYKAIDDILEKLRL